MIINHSFRSFESKIESIMKTFGPRAISNGKVLISTFMDLSPEMKREKQLLDALVKCNGNYELLEACSKPQKEQTAALTVVVHKMVDQHMLDSKIVRDFCNAFFGGIGGIARLPQDSETEKTTHSGNGSLQTVVDSGTSTGAYHLSGTDISSGATRISQTGSYWGNQYSNRSGTQTATKPINQATSAYNPPTSSNQVTIPGTSKRKVFLPILIGIAALAVLVIIIQNISNKPATSQTNETVVNDDSPAREVTSFRVTETYPETVSEEDVIRSLVEEYMQAYPYAQNNDDFSYIKQYLQPGSKLYNDMETYVQKTFNVTLESFYIESMDYENSISYVVTTVETYYIVPEISNPYTTTQRCKYRVKDGSLGWRIFEYADVIEVLSKTEQ